MARVKGRTTRIAEGMDEARERGGGIVPDANKEATKAPPISNPIAAIVKMVKPRTEHTEEEEESFKLRGQRAYYEGKLRRIGGSGGGSSKSVNKTGNYRSPSTVRDR